MDRRNESTERRDSRPDIDGTHQAALLIDFDNVTMGIRSNLGQELRTLMNSEMIRGKVAVQRAYADWRRYPQYIVPLSEASIDLIFAPAYGSSKKNATDIRLAIDALELVFVRPEIRTFILMSGDSDFSSLVLKLKEYGKYVIGVGIQESSSDLLVQNCDEYYSYSALTGLSKSGEQPTEVHDPWVLVGKAVAKMVERGDTMRSDRLKQVMIEIDPSFNEKEQGFNKFNRFVVEAASRGLISIQKMENGQYGVAPAGEPKAEKPDRSERQDARSRGRGRKRGDRRPAERPTERPTASAGSGEEEKTRRARPKLTMKSGLDLLNRSLEKLLEGDAASVRDSDVKRRMLEYDPAFDEGELGFSKFSKFLIAAEEAGAIQLTRGPQGNFHVALPKTSSKRKRRAAEQHDSEAESGQVGPEKAQGEGTVQRLARFLFGERKTREEEGGIPDADEKTAKDGMGEPSVTAAAPKPQPKTGGRGGRGPGDGRQGRSPVDSRPGERSGRGGAPERGEQRRPRGESRGGRAGPRSRGGPGRQRGEGRPREERRAPGEREKVERKEAVVEQSAPATPPASTEGEPAVRAGDRKSESRTDRPTDRGVSRPEASSAEPVAAKRESETEEKGAAERKGGPSPAPLPGAPRGTIRGRWGRSGRYRPAGAPPPIFDGQTAATVGSDAPAGEAAKAARTEEADSPEAANEPHTEGATPRAAEPTSEAKPGGGEVGELESAATASSPSAAGSSPSASTGGNAELVDHLTAYQGVGRRTAESLVEAFGAEVFRVLDEEPDRVREILPDHRAQRVLEERRRELSAGAE